MAYLDYLKIEPEGSRIRETEVDAIEKAYDPSHPMRKEMLSWGDMQGYSDFDLKSVNQSLRNI